MTRRRRAAIGLTLLGVLVFEGCVTYPAAVATKDQPPESLERDRRECRDQAADEVEPPLVTVLKRRIAWALGGAALGAGAAAGGIVAGGSSDLKMVALGVAGGAALGFVIGSLAGTWKGAGDAFRAIRGRQEVFSDCMRQRGYRVDRP